MFVEMLYISRWWIVACNVSLRVHLIDYGLRDYGTAKWIGGDAECDHLQINDTRDPKYTKQTQNAGTSKLGYKDVCGKCGAIRQDDQIGLEPTPDEYVAKLVQVFREVKRVLKDDGVLWLNLGDSYVSNPGDRSKVGGFQGKASADRIAAESSMSMNKHGKGCKPKDLIGIPWMVAFALRADGWYLRSDIIWSKPNPMPESVKDRPTKAHEYLFLLAKSQRYYYDAEAVAEPYAESSFDRYNYAVADHNVSEEQRNQGWVTTKNRAERKMVEMKAGGRNRRTVWTITTQPFKGAHFAVMPEKLVEPCVLAGSRPGDLILDPFAGSGTVGVVAQKLGRAFIGVELNPEYVKLAESRLLQTPVSLFNSAVLEDA